MVGGFESKQVTGDVWRTYGGEYGLFSLASFLLSSLLHSSSQASA
jgi:hypothetical protein